jgi:fructose-bisphosphate aldolase class I
MSAGRPAEGAEPRVAERAEGRRVRPSSLRELENVAAALVATGKGLFAMDESKARCNERFALAGIAASSEGRRAWRELLVTAPGLGEYISGAILDDETIRQKTKQGQRFVAVLGEAGIVCGVRVDAGAKAFAAHPGESVSTGLDGLRERLGEYVAMGARFAVWRAALAVGHGTPSVACIEANARALARCAALCQECGLLPVVAPQILMAGDHTLAQCQAITEEVLGHVFDALRTERVQLEATLLSVGMVLPGTSCSTQESVDEVADATVKCLMRFVPADIPGIALLSGGQSGELASARLNAMHVHYRAPDSSLPWALTFSFGGALLHPALEIWGGGDAQRPAAQQALLHQARCSRAALRGEFDLGLQRA